MRIAVSGTHRVGKTTLVESVATQVPGYTSVDEPYYLLEEDGYELAEHPSLEDFEAQLTRSLAALDDSVRDVIFDRCPLDILAYLLEHDDALAFDLEDRLEAIEGAVQTLDLIVFVPLEEVDRIALRETDERRRAVHERIRELLLDTALIGDVEVLTVSGDLRTRTGQVVARISLGTAAPTRK